MNEETHVHIAVSGARYQFAGMRKEEDIEFSFFVLLFSNLSSGNFGIKGVMTWQADVKDHKETKVKLY